MARPDSWRAKPKGGGFVVETIYDLIDEAVSLYWRNRVREARAAAGITTKGIEVSYVEEDARPA